MNVVASNYKFKDGLISGFTLSSDSHSFIGECKGCNQVFILKEAEYIGDKSFTAPCPYCNTISKIDKIV